MQQHLSLILIIVLIVSLGLLADGIVRQRRLARRLTRARRDVPIDVETGLLDRRACIPRLTAELKRAARTGDSVWVGVITVIEGDAARFGRTALDALQVPEVGFRLAESVFCFVRPAAGETSLVELAGRLKRAAPRERLMLGEATWAPDLPVQSAAELLQQATSAGREREVSS